MNLWIEAALQKALNRYLALDPESKAKIQKLNGRIVSLELKGINLNFQLKFVDTKIHVKMNSAETPDTLIKGTPLSVLHMSLSREDRKKFFSEDVNIEGNIELGQQVIALFDELEIDWEEFASQWIGDVSAHQLGRFIKKTRQFGLKVRRTILKNLDEYLHEEADLFPPKEALNDFFNDVDVLRMDVDRLTARIEKLINEAAE